MAVALIGIGMLWTLLAGVAPATTTAQAPSRPADWTEASHGDGAAPAYDRLFAVDRVHEVRITIAPEDFRTMQADLQEVTARPRGRRGFRGDAGRGGAPVLISRDPIYVPVTVGYDGRRWTQVGMRYKGNSSLAAARGGANGKLPFRLDFDRYEDDAPETSNQRFHGFSELTFSSNFADDSQLREVLSAEILRDRGVRVARTAFYRVHVDVGTGPEYWGLYTVVEDPAEGAMLDEQFGSRDGNVYKPDGPGADWTRFEPEGFDKKNNEDEADFSDVEAAIAALHAPMDDPGAWRQALERRFDVDGFLRWLAVNTAMQSWDAYGAMAHNYYLYADPGEAGRLSWVPWDHNMSLGLAVGGRRGGGGRFGGGARRPDGGPGAAGAGRPRGIGFGRGTAGPDVLHTEMGEQWPLIQRVLGDAVYAARYRELLAEAIEGALETETFERRARELHDMIAPSVVGPTGERSSHTTISSVEAFESSVDQLVGVVRSRTALIRTALAGASTQ